MQASWLHRNKKRSLIVFCNGWGMDSTPFQPLASIRYDVYSIYNYDRLGGDYTIEEVIDGYKQVILIGWSMGVWAGQRLFAGIKDIFHRTIALNGTLCPIDDMYGIPEKVYDQTLNGYNEAARLKFYRRMCRGKKTLKTFLSLQPRRLIADQKRELQALRSTVDCLPAQQSIYKEVIISENDWIVPTANQLRFWQGMEATRISGFHFPFYSWQSWDHLLCYADCVR